MSDFSTRWGSGSSLYGFDSSKWDSDKLKETDWWSRRHRKTYSSRLGFGSSDHKSYYSGGYSFSSSVRDFYRSEFGEDHARKAEILQKAYSNSRDLVNTLPIPYRVNIYYDSSGYVRNKHNHASKAEKNIFINPSCLKNISSSTSIEEEEKIIRIFTGNSLHEASHLLNTELTATIRFFGKERLVIGKGSANIIIPVDTDYMNKFLDSCFKINSIVSSEKLLETKNICKGLIYTLFNAIEGERVDTLMLEERSGWGEFFEEYKEDLYNKIYKKKEYVKPKDSKISFVEFYYTLIKFIRFPEKIEEKMYKKYSSFIDQSKKYLESSSTLGSVTSAFSLFKFVLLNILKNIDKDTSLEKFNNDIEEVIPEDLSKELLAKISSFGISDFSSTMGGQLLVVGSKDNYSLTDKSGITESMFFGGGNSVMDKNSIDIITQEIEGSISNKIFFYKPAGNLAEYEKERALVSSYIPSLKNLVRNVNKNYEFIIHGQRNGKLDTDKLAEAYQGISHVYIRRGKVTTSGMTICVVIDESGSMGGRREVLARRAAILLNEAFGSIKGVDLYIYGHTADQHLKGGTEIYTYREPGMIYVGNKPGSGISNSSAKYENRDGTAILEIAKRVRKFTQNPVLMFILSDGNPSADCYRGDSAIRDTAEKVKLVENMGFCPIQVNICSYCCDSSKMFKTFIDLTAELDELPKKLGVVVRNQLVKLMTASQSVTAI